jgi:hypothetical protein
MPLRMPLTALAAAILLAGCGGTSGSAKLTLGTAATDGTGFLPLEGNATLVSGAQGGFHVWLKFRIEGVASEQIQANHTARRTSDNKLVSVGQRFQEIGSPDAEGWWETPQGTPSFMCPTPIGVNVIGETVDFEVQILDSNGKELCTAQSTATIQCPTGTSAAFCSQICSG